MSHRELYPIEEARELLGGISRNTIYCIIRSGDLRSVVIGRRRFIPATAIASFINSSTTTERPSLAAAQSRGLTRSSEPADPTAPLPAPGRQSRS
jgi:excisionase family DNA binding protein